LKESRVVAKKRQKEGRVLAKGGMKEIFNRKGQTKGGGGALL
jgi:hypothetical protein